MRDRHIRAKQMPYTLEECFGFNELKNFFFIKKSVHRKENSSFDRYEFKIMSAFL